jgi:hypothetical protein
VGGHSKGTPPPDLFLDSQPDDLSPFDAHFRAETVALPHFKFQNAAWREAAADVGRRLTDPSHTAFIFRGRAVRAVPADGLPDFASNIWVAPLTN